MATCLGMDWKNCKRDMEPIGNRRNFHKFQAACEKLRWEAFCAMLMCHPNY